MTFALKVKIAVIGIFVICAAAVVAPYGKTQTQIETAGQKFKSIKVLNDMPADQMGKVMNMMSASLGVDCKFCHASNDGDYEKEGFEHKDIARNMLKMTFELNKNYFESRPEINCNTCHQGKSHPQPSFPLKPLTWIKASRLCYHGCVLRRGVTKQLIYHILSQSRVYILSIFVILCP